MIATKVASTITVNNTSAREPMQILCWRCDNPLASIYSAPAFGCVAFRCSRCDACTQCKDGIWRAISPNRLEYFSRFTKDYERIRAEEGRGSDNPDYYLELPFRDITERNSKQWHIRAASFRYIDEHILTPLSAARSRPLRVLDLGAGNGWMSYRMALRGHDPVAIDLLVNSQDGLGAATHFALRLHSLFPRVQAELDRLPLPSCTSDVTLFNASFHYSENYERTLAEAMRCTRAGGIVLIADTPLYQDEDSGKKMVEEKHRHFFEKYGTPSNSITTLEYLTPIRLAQIQQNLDLCWKEHRPSYGLHWNLRPLHAKLRGNRPPSSFRVYTAVVSK